MYLLKLCLPLACGLALCACIGSTTDDVTQTDEPDVGTTTFGIFGGVEVADRDPVALSSIALLEGDGDQVCSGTLIASRLIVSAAHCFATFRPEYVSFGIEVPQKSFWTDDLGDRRKFPNIRSIVSVTIHPDYDPSVTSGNAEELRPTNDVAIAVIADGAPGGFVPARVIAPGSSLTELITLAGFGAFPAYDPLNPQPPRLRKVDSFVGTFLPQSKMMKDGPNPGKGSCVRDSGGSIYLRTSSAETPILVGSVVSGPYDCSQGVGYNSDLRYYVDWIERAAATTLSKVVISSTCNDGVVDAGELCDGPRTCKDLDARYVGGTATCVACTGYDVSSCVQSPPRDSCVSAPCRADHLPLAIPDQSPTGVTSAIVVDGSSAPIAAVVVAVRVSHTYRGDLELTLISPAGKQLRLHDRTGGSADNLSINAELSAFSGESSSGQWRLLVRDLANGDTGALDSWSLQVIPRVIPTCGNGKIEGAEVCDREPTPCTTLDAARYASGEAFCAADCGSYAVDDCTLRTRSDDCVDQACSADARRAIPDNNSAGVGSELTIASFSGTAKLVRVTVDVVHPYRGDLRVRLVSPSGRVVTLFDRTGGSADDLGLDLALSDFASTSPVGLWKLIVSDHSARDQGTLTRWSLRFTK